MPNTHMRKCDAHPRLLIPPQSGEVVPLSWMEALIKIQTAYKVIVLAFWVCMPITHTFQGYFRALTPSDRLPVVLSAPSFSALFIKHHPFFALSLLLLHRRALRSGSGRKSSLS